MVINSVRAANVAKFSTEAAKVLDKMPNIPTNSNKKGRRRASKRSYWQRKSSSEHARHSHGRHKRHEVRHNRHRRHKRHRLGRFQRGLSGFISRRELPTQTIYKSRGKWRNRICLCFTAISPSFCPASNRGHAPWHASWTKCKVRGSYSDDHLYAYRCCCCRE